MGLCTPPAALPELNQHPPLPSPGSAGTPSWSICFLICEMGIKKPPSQDCYENSHWPRVSSEVSGLPHRHRLTITSSSAFLYPRAAAPGTRWSEAQASLLGLHGSPVETEFSVFFPFSFPGLGSTCGLHFPPARCQSTEEARRIDCPGTPEEMGSHSHLRTPPPAPAPDLPRLCLPGRGVCARRPGSLLLR